MLDYKEEKQDVESFITGIVKKLSAPNKQRAADILVGLQLAETPAIADHKKAKYPHGSVPAQCG